MKAEPIQPPDRLRVPTRLPPVANVTALVRASSYSGSQRDHPAIVVIAEVYCSPR